MTMADLPPACKDVLAAPGAAGQSGERRLTSRYFIPPAARWCISPARARSSIRSRAMLLSRVSFCLRKRSLGGEIGYHDTQPVIARARHQVAFEHFRPARDGSWAKRSSNSSRCFSQFDRDEHADRQPDRALVEHRDIARGSRRIFRECARAAGRARRQPDFAGQVGEAHAAVVLQQAQDSSSPPRRGPELA